MAKSSKGDAGERIAARKQTFHNCSAAFCIMLAVLGVCLALQREQQEGSAGTIYLLAGVFQTVMSLIALFMGVLLPEEGGRMPGWARRIVRAVAFVAMLGGRGTSGAAAYGVFNGDVVFRRFWEPAWFVAWLLFEGMLLWFYPGSGSLAALVILSMALLIALIAASAGWSIQYRRERGDLKWFYIAGPSLVVVVLFGAVFLSVYISEARRAPALAERLAAARAEIERALADYEDGSYREGAVDSARMSMDDIIGMLKHDVGGNVCYCWVPGDGDGQISMVAWNDAGGDVYVYQFTERDGAYSLDMGFVSSSLTWDAVEGKEHGVIPAG